MKSISTIIMLTVAFVLLSSVASFAQKGPVQVIVAPVVERNFSDRVEALGTTKANETVMITADRAEKITQIHFEDGQQVKQGDLLITLDKGQEEAELRAAQALTSETQSAYNRAKGLSGNSALPKATLQERLAELKQSQAVTESLKARLKDYKIHAPFDGIVGLRNVSIGTLVQPGDTITTIDDLRQVKVDFDVPDLFLATLKPGLPITGTVEAFGERVFSGTVTTINTQIDPVTRTVKVRAILPNTDGVLKPGLMMSIVLSKNPRQNLSIPEEALLKRGAKNFVFKVVQEGDKTIAKQTEVTLGTRYLGSIEILSGIDVGDEIVNHGTVKVRDGTEVSIRAAENKDTSLENLLKQKQGASTPETVAQEQ